eukprot:8022704-Heterocapsa_arctica.AAC.1
MGKVKILEGPQGRRGHAAETLQVEQSVENMPRAIAHSELTPSRTCVEKKADGKFVKEEDIGE